MKIGSLFSGIGGLELGLERAGVGHVVWQVEMDPFCSAVLAKHWPEAVRHGDVRAVGAANLDRVDVICGGFPCQDVSLAGTGAGLDGARSGLWSEFARIVRELRPRFVVVENVAALLRRGIDRVLGSLAALGYDAAWHCFGAADVGAPHRRDRIFLVAWRVSDAHGEPVRELTERGHGCAQAADERDAVPAYVGERLADPDRWGREMLRVAGRQPGHGGAPRHIVDGCDVPIWPPAPNDMLAWEHVPAGLEPAVCRMADGVAGRSHRHRAIGNAVCPAQAEVVGRVIAGALS
jgi:DNA (cytosine-5)-methyltransferase 1